MPKIIDSQALGIVNKSLGLTGRGAAETELLDGTVDQVLDVGPIARRGGTLAGTEGVFRVVLRNIHAGAGDVSTSWQPYSSAAVGTFAPFPTPMPDNLDVWLLGASVQIVSGAGSLEHAALRLTNVQLGVGIDSAAAAIASTSVMTLAYWNTSLGFLSPSFAATQSRLPYKALNIRIPRKGAVASPFVVFGSQSSGVNSIDAVLLVGVFPVALGQDAVQG